MALSETALAFVLVSGAGMSTALGGCLSFCAELTSVMIYIAFISIMIQSQEKFVDAGYPGNRAWQLAPAFFFAGALLVWLLDKAVHNLHATPRDFAAADFRNRIIQSLSSSAQKKNAQSCARKEWRSERECQQLHSHQQPGHKQQSKSDEDEENPSHSDQDNNARDENKEGSDERREEGSHHTSQSEQAAANGLANQKAASLGKLGILTALSIALHNLPEGAAVYISATSGASVGIAVSVAIALHNIPEGACVSLPLYYSSGNRWQGLLWAILSGLTEPLGGLIAFAVLRGNSSHFTFGILYGLVAGCMVYISIVNMLPTARKYDPNDKYTSKFMWAGMLVMGASLVTFEEAAPEL